jgi:DNA-binding MarR family transcriptional regulator
VEGQPASERILSIMSHKLRASYDFIRRRMAESGLSDLDISHGDILYLLYFRGPLSMTELAAGIGRDKSTVTALVKKMEALDLVRRDRNEDDARIAVVSLTAKGAGYRPSFMAISEEIRALLYRGFSESEKATLAALLSRLGEPD